jgi:hypothetical protein
MPIGTLIIFQLVYALSLIILSIPFFYLKKSFCGIYKHHGLILAISGGCHLIFILFPIGIMGTLLFEVLLVVLLFQWYQKSIAISRK